LAGRSGTPGKPAPTAALRGRTTATSIDADDDPESPAAARMRILAEGRPTVHAKLGAYKPHLVWVTRAWDKGLSAQMLRVRLYRDNYRGRTAIKTGSLGGRHRSRGQRILAGRHITWRVEAHPELTHRRHVHGAGGYGRKWHIVCRARWVVSGEPFGLRAGHLLVGIRGGADHIMPGAHGSGPLYKSADTVPYKLYLRNQNHIHPGNPWEKRRLSNRHPRSHRKDRAKTESNVVLLIRRLTRLFVPRDARRLSGLVRLHLKRPWHQHPRRRPADPAPSPPRARGTPERRPFERKERNRDVGRRGGCSSPLSLGPVQVTNTLKGNCFYQPAIPGK